MNYQLTPWIPVYYINLEDNIDRNEHISYMLNNYGFMNIKRIEAEDTRTQEKIDTVKNLIDPISYKMLLQNIKTGRRLNHRDITPGAIGCALSHIKIYKKMIEENIPYAIVFEDDCGIKVNSQKFWKILSSLNIPQSTDIFLMDGGIYDYDEQNYDGGDVARVFYFWGFDFYLITLEGAKKAVKYLQPIRYHIDNHLSKLSYNGLINIYGYMGEQMARQLGGNDSNIDVLKCKDCDMYNEIDQVRKSNLLEYFSPVNDDNSGNNFLWLIIILVIVLLFYKYRDRF